MFNLTTQNSLIFIFRFVCYCTFETLVPLASDICFTQIYVSFCLLLYVWHSWPTCLTYAPLKFPFWNRDIPRRVSGYGSYIPEYSNVSVIIITRAVVVYYSTTTIFCRHVYMVFNPSVTMNFTFYNYCFSVSVGPYFYGLS